MQTLRQDLKYIIRFLSRQKSFVLVVVGMLALAIGANTALFSFADALLFRPLPFTAPERLVLVKQGVGTLLEAVFDAPDKFMQRKQPVQSLESLAAYDAGRANLTDEHTPERAQVMRVSAEFFPLLGVNPLLGRWFSADEQRSGGNRVALLSHELWQRRYGGSPDILRQTIRLNGVGFDVVGVMPPSFQYAHDGRRAALWIPLLPNDDVLAKETYYWEAIGKLKVGVPLEQAQAELTLLNQRLKLEVKTFGEFTYDPRVRLSPLSEKFSGEIQKPLLMLLAAVAFVLLIACANVANLLLARSVARGKETALRAALGASRARLLRLWLTESLLLAAVGGALGLLLSIWLVDALTAVSPTQIASLNSVTLHWRVLLFCLGVTFLTGLLCGLIPAWQASKPDLAQALKESGSRTAIGMTPRLRRIFTVGEVALALVLLLGAGLMVRSFYAVMQLQPGFNPERVLTFELAPTALKYGTPEQRAAFYQSVIERLQALPGVEAVGSASHLPMAANAALNGWPIKREGDGAEKEGIVGLSQVAGAGYFRALGIPVLAGRIFNEQDRRGAPRVLMLNQTLARKLFQQDNPVGKRVLLDRGNPQVYEVVGVVGDVKTLGLESEVLPEFYLHSQQQPAAFISVAMKTAGDPAASANAVRQALAELDRDQPLYNLKTLEQHLSDAVARRRFPMVMLGTFALVALLLSAAGLFAVMSQMVSQRTHEIGIRVALGAGSRDVLRLIVGQGMKLVAAGVALGLFGAFGLARLIAGLLYGVKAADPLSVLAASGLLIGVAFVACWIPAWRATKVDPMVALRCE
ncbi:MAG TPA: ABC transporter permease [Blastocatellia bacterium]|nr:ABC transporter permease [Blastocatellia bacterium]